MRHQLQLQARRRLYAIYRELGYNPWRKPRKARKQREGVYMGTREAIPFLNDDAKRTIFQLFFRPGYMMRDYIVRGQHERYLAPFTALLVFYSVFTLLLAIVRPGALKATVGDGILEGLGNTTVQADTLGIDDERAQVLFTAMISTVRDAIYLTHLDVYPEAVDTPWKESLAAVEDDIRSKGIPMFMGSFLFLWLAMASLLKRYQISISGAAAATAYILCQFCVFMFLALLFSLGQKTELDVLFMGALLFVDYRELLGIDNKRALVLTVRTGLRYLLFLILFYLLLAGVLVLLTLLRVQ